MADKHPSFNIFSEEVFQQFDTTQTGYADQKDALKMILKTYSKIGLNKLLNQEILEQFLTQIEIIKAGYLSLAEFKTLMKKICPQ